MQTQKTKKTIKVLYLYMTIPLLFAAGAMWILSSFGADEDRTEEIAAKAAVDNCDAGYDDPDSKSFVKASLDDDLCESHDDCRVGEVCEDGVCVNPLRIALNNPPTSEDRVGPKSKDGGIGGTEWAAIIAAIMGGLTGLVGAVTQAVLAFLTIREKRRIR